jgi:nucleotide-binding universal stress UspA family protein
MAAPDFRTILCPIDFSELSAAAVRVAARLSRPGERLLALHADEWQAPAYFTEANIEELRLQFRQFAGQAEERLRQFVVDALKEQAVEVKIVEGSPAEAILRVSDETRAGLIVMGTHGRSGWNRWTLGSVTERVLHRGSIPVLTIRSVSNAPIRSILCPVSDQETSGEIVGVAADWAGRFGANLTLLHVIEPRTVAVSDLCTWIGPEVRAQCNVRELIQHGNPAEEIVSISRNGMFNLIVLAAPRRRFFDGVQLGSTTLQVVRHAECPVLTFPTNRRWNHYAQP